MVVILGGRTAPLGHDGGGGYVEERGSTFGGDGFGQHGFACAPSLSFGNIAEFRLYREASER